MENRFLDAFANATTTTLSTMCGCECKVAGAYAQQDGAFPANETVAIMGLSGKARGAVIMTMSVATAQAVVGSFIGEAITTVSGELTDGIGEILNILAGAAAAELEDLQLKISLPTVLVGKEQKLATRNSAPWWMIPIEVAGMGTISIKVSLVE